MQNLNTNNTNFYTMFWGKAMFLYCLWFILFTGGGVGLFLDVTFCYGQHPPPFKDNTPAPAKDSTLPPDSTPPDSTPSATQHTLPDSTYPHPNGQQAVGTRPGMLSCHDMF